MVFRVFLPATLFLNVYKISDPGAIDFSYVLYVMAGILVIFSVALTVVLWLIPQPERRGAVLQGSFRSNFALVGLHLAGSLAGEEGVIAASILTAVVVPAFNVMAIISLSVFRSDGGKVSVRKVLKDIFENPLIRSIFLGAMMLVIRAIFEANDVSFRLTDIQPLYTTLDYLSRISTPLALLVLGAQFEFSAVASLKKELALGILLRTVLAPALTLGIAYFFFRDRFLPAHFAAIAAVFSTPVAVSSVPMAQEMKGAHILMGQLVVWTTFFSAFSIFLASFLLRLGGAL